jgi:hypothetical protein
MTDDKPAIPEPTDFATAREDGVADRIASADTEGGADQFSQEAPDERDRPVDETSASGGEPSGL